MKSEIVWLYISGYCEHTCFDSRIFCAKDDTQCFLAISQCHSLDIRGSSAGRGTYFEEK